MKGDFYNAIKDRRSIYGLSKESTITDEKIKEIIDFSVKYTPSSFNSQSARVVLLLGEHHNKLWDMTKEALRKVVPSDQFSSTEEKINSFKNGYGSVLYFEDQSVVKSLQEQYPLYKDNFPIWSQQSSGMLQYVIWTSLEKEGFGASLQHYNPLIDESVRQAWKVPSNWKLIAQMPFGKPTVKPDEKEFQPLENRVKVFK